MPSQRKSRSFTPSLVDSLEARVVLNGGGFQFPAVLGPVSTLGYRGKFVLTSRTYGQVQNDVNRTFQAFANQFARAYQHSLNNGLDIDTALGTVPGGKMGEGPGQYISGLLGQIDRIMAGIECRLPYGRAQTGNTGGVGLSTQTIASARSNVTGWSVAEHLDALLNSDNVYSAAEALAAIESVRQSTLNFVGNGVQNGVVSPGFLPAYIRDYGPSGSGEFGLRNSGTCSNNHDTNGSSDNITNNGGTLRMAQSRAALVRFARR